MKFFGSLFLVLFTLIFFSCQNAENSVVSANDNPEAISSQTDNSVNILTISKEIDGQIGGQIPFSSTIINSQGNPVLVDIVLTFDSGSFVGKKTITIYPDVNKGFVQFTPKMTFLKPVKLDLSFTGVNLKNLGFNSNSTVDFVYMDDNGGFEYILKNECKIKWVTQKLYVKKALLPHFSRYGFVRKSQ
jgi:hypothetical protein